MTMGPFTRSEILILAFIGFFAASGAVLDRVRGPVKAPVTLLPAAFPVRAEAAPLLDGPAGVAPVSPQIVKKLENGEEKININRAGAEKLVRLRGIGPSLASRIIEYRQKNGAFKSLDELRNIKGIGEKKLAAILPMIEL